MATGLSRVTIVSPHSRLDVALPADVPLVDMLPTLLGFAGGATEDPARRDGWALSRLGGAELDNARTPAQLSVRDGELLYLRPRGDQAIATVFDDLVDAVGTGTRELRGRWSAATTRLAMVVAGMVTLLAGAAALPFAGPPFAAPGLAGLALAATLLGVSVTFARATGDTRTGTAFALVATVYAGVGGLLVLGGDAPLTDLTVANVIVAATAAAVSAIVASVGLPTAAALFLGAGAGASATFATMAIAAGLGTSLASAAAVTVVIAYAALPAMPMLAYRLAGLPRPAVPTEREHLRQETEVVDSARVFELVRRVDAYLSSMLGALAFISAGAALVVAFAGGWGIVLASVLALLPILRSRSFDGRALRLPLVLSGGLAAAAVAVELFLTADREGRLFGVLAVVVVAAAGTVALGLAGPRQQSSPPWNRFLDIVELVLIVALLPLVAWVSGVLEWARAIKG